MEKGLRRSPKEGGEEGLSEQRTRLANEMTIELTALETWCGPAGGLQLTLADLRAY